MADLKKRMSALIEASPNEPDPPVFRKIVMPKGPGSAAELHTWLAALGDALSEWRFDRNLVNGWDWDSLPTQLECEDSVSQTQLEASVDRISNLLRIAEKDIREVAFLAKSVDEEFFGRILSK